MLRNARERKLSLIRNISKTRHPQVALNTDGCRPAPSGAVCPPVIDHDIRGSARNVRRMRRNRRAVYVVIDSSRNPYELVMVEIRIRGREEHAAVLLLAGAYPIGHPDRIRILTFDLEINFGLGVVYKTESSRDLPRHHRAHSGWSRRRRTRPHHPLIRAVSVSSQGLKFAADRHN